MTKRYNSPREVAGVMLEQCHESVRAVCKMMAPSTPPTLP